MRIMDNRTNLAATIVAVAALAGVAAPAGADFYQFTFGGEIDVINGVVPEPWETVHVGSEFEYTYIFDSEAEDQSGLPWLGRYDLLWAQVTIEGVAQATEDGLIFVENSGNDRYTAYFENLPIGGASGNVSLTGRDDVIDSDDLLLDIDLDDWVHGTLFEAIGVGLFEIYGHVTSFEGDIIPGPSALPCLVTGALLTSRRRQRPRNTN